MLIALSICIAIFAVAVLAVMTLGTGASKRLTVRLAALDPAFAPGTGTPQVGGLSSDQTLRLVRTLKGLNLVGCDLVEVSPQYDSAEITSLLAANLLFEQLCLFCFLPAGNS